MINDFDAGMEDLFVIIRDERGVINKCLHPHINKGLLFLPVNFARNSYNSLQQKLEHLKLHIWHVIFFEFKQTKGDASVKIESGAWLFRTRKFS